MEAYRVWQLTINFELWVEIFCVPTWFHMRIPKPCPSVSPYPENWNHPGFVNISLTLVNDTSMERSSRVPQYENLIFFLFKNVQNWQNWILSVVHWETKSSWLRQYQSYISYWYVILRMLRPDWWRGGNNFHDQTLTQKVSTCMNIQWIKDPIMTISKRFTNFNFYNLG